MSENTNTTGLKVAIGIAAALFLVTAIMSGVFYTSKVRLSEEKDLVEQQLTEEKELVLKDLNEMAARYDAAIQENSDTNQELEFARDRIEELITSLDSSEANIKTLWKYKRKYLELQEEMDVILQENDELKVANQLLEGTLDSTKVKLEERTVFTDSLLVQNNALAEVVENAAVLTAVNLKGFGVIERSSGRIIPTERARRSDKIRVCFAVAKNRLVQAGDKEFYVQVIGPNNNVLGVNKQVSFDDESLNYSLISKFNYENNNLDVCEFIAKNDDSKFSKGLYKVSVFNGSELIANNQFTLR